MAAHRIWLSIRHTHTYPFCFTLSRRLITEPPLLSGHAWPGEPPDTLLCRLQSTADKIRVIKKGKPEVRILPEAESNKREKNAARAGSKCSDQTAAKAALPASLRVQMDLVRAETGSDVKVPAAMKTEKAVSAKTGQAEAESRESAAGAYVIFITYCCE